MPGEINKIEGYEIVRRQRGLANDFAMRRVRRERSVCRLVVNSLHLTVSWWSTIAEVKKITHNFLYIIIILKLVAAVIFGLTAVCCI